MHPMSCYLSSCVIHRCEVADAEVYEEAEVEDMSEGNTVDEKVRRK